MAEGIAQLVRSGKYLEYRLFTMEGGIEVNVYGLEEFGSPGKCNLGL